MRFVVYGAGGIGGTIGGRLHQAGHDVVLIARGAHAEVMQRDGLHLVGTDGAHTLSIPVRTHPREVDWRSDDIALLTMKSQHTTAALEDLAQSAPSDIAVVCGQNGVANERMALRRFARVYGTVVHLPTMYVKPGQVVTYADGRGGVLDTGCYPSGVDDTCTTITDAFESAGFVARPDPAIMRMKYAKLLVNLANAPHAATGMSGEDAAKITGLLRAEGMACLEAAGIEGIDVAELQERHEGVYRTGEIPGFPRGGGSTWQSLERGTSNVESDYLNGEIVLLGRLHGVPTPANAVCQRLAGRMAAEGASPGSMTVQQLLDLIEQEAAAG